MKTLYFVRHGQTDWNKALRWQGGAADTELNQTGREQAQMVAIFFDGLGIKPQRVISSPLKRARYTASRVVEALAIPLSVEEAFRELNLGDFEGKTTDELKVEYGAKFDLWLERYHLDAPPGGESLQQAIERMQGALAAHIERAEYDIIIVAHQAIMMAMKAALSGKTDIESLAAYKQANNEIDVWDAQKAEFVERVSL